MLNDTSYNANAFASTFYFFADTQTNAKKTKRAYQRTKTLQILTDSTSTEEKALLVTRVWQKWRFSAPQTVLWLIKHWFSASTFVVKIATFAKPETVSGKFKNDNDKKIIKK
jgi:hypothetical protein